MLASRGVFLTEGAEGTKHNIDRYFFIYDKTSACCIVMRCDLDVHGSFKDSASYPGRCTPWCQQMAVKMHDVCILMAGTQTS